MEVALHTGERIYSPRHVPSWLLLAGSAGLVNGIAFLMCEQFVTHVTGTVTRIGLEWPHIGIAVEYALIVVCFILGGAASVVTIQARAQRGKRPRWAFPLVVVAAILLGVAIAGHFGAFGKFQGTLATDEPPAVLLAILAFAMGLQNAAVATTTGLAVRTTHLTGPASDLGVHLGILMISRGRERRPALRAIGLRGGKIVAFMIGAGCAVPLAANWAFLSFLAPAASVLLAAGLSFTAEWSAELP